MAYQPSTFILNPGDVNPQFASSHSDMGRHVDVVVLLTIVERSLQLELRVDPFTFVSGKVYSSLLQPSGHIDPKRTIPSSPGAII